MLMDNVRNETKNLKAKRRVYCTIFTISAYSTG